jgi:hypothetical protein
VRVAPGASRDEWIERLARLFREHPAWVAAARHLSPDATSSVYFRHRPGEPFHLEQGRSGSLLLPGAARDPDLAFRFAPRSVERLEAVRGGIGDFAVELFSLITGPDPDARVDLRIAASFPRLARRGYVALLLRAGPRVLAFGARRGVRTLAALRRLVADLRRPAPEPWEADDPQP